jgi:hypothetical protein
VGDLNSTPVTGRLLLIFHTSRLAWFSPGIRLHDSEIPFPVSKETGTWYNLPASSASCKNVWDYAFIKLVVPLWAQGQIYLLMFEYSNISSNIILTYKKLEHIWLWELHCNPRNMLDIGNNCWPFSSQFHSCNLWNLKVSLYSARISCIFDHLFIIYWTQAHRFIFIVNGIMFCK